MAGNKPEQTFRIGLISASVFVNEVEAGEGARRESREVRSVVFQRRYRDRDSGEWRSSDSFGVADLAILKEVIAMALAYVAAKEACG
jgi:hypothetical protein